MRMRKVRTIAGFELFSTLRRPAYLITTFGMPLILLFYAGFGVLMTGMMVRSETEKERVYGVVDRSALLALTEETRSGPVELPAELEDAVGGRTGEVFEKAAAERGAAFRPYSDEASARAALDAGALTGYYVIAADYMDTGTVSLVLPSDADWKERGARGALERMLRDRLLEDIDDTTLSARIQTPIAGVEQRSAEVGGEEIERPKGARAAAVIIPIAFAMLLFIALAMSTGYLMQGTAAEKENKVVDVLLSAAAPNEILFGKLLGLGGAGLLQISVWFSMIVIAAYGFAATIASYGIVVPWRALAVAPPFFAAAYFFTGALILGTGSLGKNLKEVQQFGMIWSLASALPLMMMGVLISDPHGTVGKIMTWIPFSAPVTVVLRLSLGPEGVAWWEIAGAFAVMIAATWLGLEIGARLFRVGLLLSGSRPGWRALIRQARLGR